MRKQKIIVNIMDCQKRRLRNYQKRLENPVIFNRIILLKKESVVAVLDFRDKDGKPIIVAIHPNGQAVL